MISANDVWVNGVKVGGPEIGCEYLGRDEDGLHTFRTPELTAKMDDGFLGALNAHPEVARLHAEAMERAKA